MSVIGNFLLLLSLLAAIFLFKMTFLQKMPGGDYGVGYAWSVLMLMAFFWICLALVAVIIGSGGGFAWLSLGRFAGGGMLVLGFLVMLLGSNLGVSRGLRIFQLLTPINAVASPLGVDDCLCSAVE